MISNRCEDVDYLYRHAKRIVVFVIGATVVLIGIALLVLPGPGLLVILAGLAILGAEFAWARSVLKKLKSSARSGLKKMKDIVS